MGMSDDQQEFLLTLRRALLLIIRWIERREAARGKRKLGNTTRPRDRGHTLTGGDP